MAAPFVTGIIGTLMSLHKSHKTFNCALMMGLIDQLSIKGILTGLGTWNPEQEKQFLAYSLQGRAPPINSPVDVFIHRPRSQ